MDTACYTPFVISDSTVLVAFVMAKKNPPTTRSTRSARQILKGSNHILQSLYAQTRALKSVEATIAHYISDEFAVSSFKNNELTLICPSGATATKLRYRQRNIISALRRAGMEVDSLKVKVQPINDLTTRVEIERQLTASGAALLRATAEDLADSPLRDALIKLAKNRNNTD